MKKILTALFMLMLVVSVAQWITREHFSVGDWIGKR
jgi:hypothetical protein